MSKMTKKQWESVIVFLKNASIAIISVPLSRKPETWESPAGMSVHEIEVIVDWDQKRYYGYAFADKLKKFGFKVDVFKITEAEATLHGIASGNFNDEKFIAKK